MRPGIKPNSEPKEDERMKRSPLDISSKEANVSKMLSLLLSVFSYSDQCKL